METLILKMELLVDIDTNNKRDVPLNDLLVNVQKLSKKNKHR